MTSKQPLQVLDIETLEDVNGGGPVVVLPPLMTRRAPPAPLPPPYPPQPKEQTNESGVKNEHKD